MWAVRGELITQYYKPGYNVIVRTQRGDTPDDKIDCFMWIGFSRTLEGAKKLCNKTKDETEIVKFKLDSLRV